MKFLSKRLVNYLTIFLLRASSAASPTFSKFMNSITTSKIMKEDYFYYFAYGSNISPSTLRKYCSSAEKVCTAKLNVSGYRITDLIGYECVSMSIVFFLELLLGEDF